jgi:hypothetical protein
VQNHGNWSWVNEGTPTKPKWGYVSRQIGAIIVLKLDTRASPASPPAVTNTGTTAADVTAGNQALSTSTAAAEVTSTEAGVATPSSNSSSSSGSSHLPNNDTPDMIVWVGYVKSWRHMGSATISCIGGCRCQQVVVDGMHGEGNTQQHMAKLFATQAEECLVQVKVS